MQFSTSGLLLLLVGFLLLAGFLTGNLDRWIAYLFDPTRPAIDGTFSGGGFSGGSSGGGGGAGGSWGTGTAGKVSAGSATQRVSA